MSLQIEPSSRRIKTYPDINLVEAKKEKLELLSLKDYNSWTIRTAADMRSHFFSDEGNVFPD